ncbi:related to MIP18 family protein YHR122W [Hanseniaspora guilliermondii]|uniref:Related to MIP18 family protein YHR122W n=1 Tax=Hanseniaspora guilliermondii TaxID=56406 RepID=A0A1L0B1A1_9ASCO|nr:related to MIP18 family protein YHR122W [Hanseniaspora guilliermondii]
MSDFINENPNVLDEAQLPTRNQDNDNDHYDVFQFQQSQHDNNGLCSLMASKRLSYILQDAQNDNTSSSILEDIDSMSQLIHLQSDFKNQRQASMDLDISMEDETEERQKIDPQEIYDLIAHISDPEHPMSLGQLSIVKLEDIKISDETDSPETRMKDLVIQITPTITHCSLATLIGLGIRVRLDRALHPKYRPTIILKPGTHQSENQVNKQLNDKERVAAACENEQLLNVIRKMLSTCK